MRRRLIFLRPSAPSAVTALVLAVFLGLASASESALAEEISAAESASVALSERRAADAFQAYTRKDYALAIALYLDAYEAAPSGSILYNIARIYDLKLGDHALAISFYRRYVADPGTHAEMVGVANQRLRELRETELPPVRVTEARPAPEPDTKLSERGSPYPAREAPQARRGGWSTLRWVGVALGAAGLVGVGVGTGFGLAAMSKAHTADNLCDGNACTSQEGVDAAHAAHGHATISNIGFGAGAALLVTGAALFFVGTERAPQPRSYADLRLETRPTPSGLSMQLSGRW